MSLDYLLELAHYDPQCRVHGIQSLLMMTEESITDRVECCINGLNDLEPSVVKACLNSIEHFKEEIFINGHIDVQNTIILSLQSFALNEHNDRECRLVSINVLLQYAQNAVNLRLPAYQNRRLHDVLFVAFSETAVCSLDTDLRQASFTLLTNLHHIDVLLLKQAFIKSRLPELVEAVPDGACGVFLHGLEDEMERVRLQCIKCIFQHTLVNNKESDVDQLVVDTIIDSFLDDSSLVRLSAVKTLTSICIIHRVKLDTDRGELTMQLLVDQSEEIRKAVRTLLQVCILDGEECVREAFKAMTRAYSLYPQEANELVLIGGKIGQNHVQLVTALIPQLLRMKEAGGVDGAMLLVEPRVEDHNYQVVLSAVLNACSVDPPLVCPHLPAFIFKQYHYLRAKHRASVPCLLHLPDFQNS